MTADDIKRIYLEQTGFDLDDSDAALIDFARTMWGLALESAMQSLQDAQQFEAYEVVYKIAKEPK